MRVSFKLWIIGILFILLIGATYRFSLSQYEEECLEYKYLSYNRVEYHCDSMWRHLMMCYKMTDMGEWISQVPKDVSYIKSEIDCNCPKIKNRTVINWNKTDECVKFHLVRKVSQNAK